MSCKCFGGAILERKRSSSGQTSHGFDGMQDMYKWFGFYVQAYHQHNA